MHVIEYLCKEGLSCILQSVTGGIHVANTLIIAYLSGFASERASSLLISSMRGSSGLNYQIRLPYFGD